MSRVWREAIWLPARFDIDLLVVHVKIGGPAARSPGLASTLQASITKWLS